MQLKELTNLAREMTVRTAISALFAESNNKYNKLVKLSKSFNKKIRALEYFENEN